MAQNLYCKYFSLALLVCWLPLFALERPVQAADPSAEVGPNQARGDRVRQQEGDWKRSYERYFGNRFAQPLLTTPAIQTQLRQLSAQTGSRAAVLYLVPKAQHLELFLVTGQTSSPPIRVPASDRATLQAIATQFRREVSDPAKVNSTSYLAAAQQLYQRLIAPVAAELERQQIETLLLCPGPGLRSLPFAALHDGRDFLVARYHLSLIPAFSLTDPEYTNLQTAAVLAMGASTFPDLTPLPAVPEELAAIAALRGGVTFLNQQFTVDNLQTQQQQAPYQILHLATHAEFKTGAAAASFIQFWDREVPLDQLPRLGLDQPPVQLLVLSACRTALGDERAELGFAGMALQAGVNSVVGSLWSVSDQGTLALMQGFYQQLKTAPIKAAALRQAQLAMLRGQVRLGSLPLAHPYYWAAFTLVGSPW